MENFINEAISKVSHDAILQRIDTIAITYHTTDGNVHSFSYVGKDNSIYALIGMIDALKDMAYDHFESQE